MNAGTRVLDEARRRGINPADLDQKRYMALAVNVRSPLELVRDLSKREFARVTTTLGFRVPLDVLVAREDECRSNRCGKHRILKDGAEVCDSCSCSGRDLRMKRRAPHESCPEGKWPRFTGAPIEEDDDHA